jgi:hypothetical protein
MSTINSCRPTHRRPFLFCLLLALLLAGVVGLTAPARKAAARPSLLPRPNAAHSAANVTANEGRDFAGFYKELSATDLGDTVRVSLRFKVFNYSGADVGGATVRLANRMRPNESHGSIANVSIADRQSVVLTGDFTVSRREHEQWRKGPSPFLMIEYRNGQGADVRRMIELLRSLVGEVQ